MSTSWRNSMSRRMPSLLWMAPLSCSWLWGRTGLSHDPRTSDSVCCRSDVPPVCRRISRIFQGMRAIFAEGLKMFLRPRRCSDRPAAFAAFKREQRSLPSSLIKTLRYFQNIKFCKAQSWVNFLEIFCILAHILVRNFHFGCHKLNFGGIPKDTKKPANSQNFVYELVG